MINCPSCETPNAADARFCERCGAALAGPADATQLIDPAEASLVTSGDPVPVDDAARQALLELARRELAEDYDVDKEIGRGGMAVVYKAKERELRRTVALKVLPPGLALGASVVERFKREAQMAASLDHPNIIPIYRVGQTASMLYLAMRYVEGRPLDSVIAQQGALSVPAVIGVLRSAVAALTYAHEHGIVHRDIKGANILIDTSGRVIVTDFGVARAVENASMTTTGSVIGTPYFMSPEACAGKVAGPQSDQYSLGVVVFQMLTGAVPFHADTLAAIMNHHLITPVPDITGVRKDVPPALVAVLKRMLMKDPAQRYGTTRELLVAVDAIPLTEAERTEGEAALRELATGSAVESIATQKLPPLADTMGIVAAHDALLRSTERARRNRRRRYIIAGATVLVMVLYMALRSRSSAAPRAQGTQVAVQPAPVIPAVTTPVQPPPVVAPPVETKPTPVADPDAQSRRARAARRRADSIAATTVAPVDTTPGRVRVRALPGDAVLYVDGRQIGTGIVLDAPIPPGRRTLRVAGAGYQEFDTLLTVEPGKTINLGTITLKDAGAKP
ncbi:MAG TPA: protein kinase [Gemmatimonadaceae bacterium]|nr:protein kinase [Gemmatimonadaceae bacterium]